MSTFNPNVPTGLVNLDQDYKNLQLNFNQINNTYATDHVALTEASGLIPAGSGGAHKVVHMTSFSTLASNPPNNQPVASPAAVGLMGELFIAQINDGINSDEALYYKSGGGRLTQFTRNFQPSISTSGYTFLPGGLILQYGSALTLAGGNTPVTFNASAPFTNIFTVNVTRNQNSVSTTVCGVASVIPTGFTFTDSSGAVGSTFYWIALGN